MDSKVDLLFEEIGSLKALNNTNKAFIEADPLFEVPELPIKTVANFLMINNNCLNATYKDQMVC